MRPVIMKIEVAMRPVMMKIEAASSSYNRGEQFL